MINYRRHRLRVVFLLVLLPASMRPSSNVQAASPRQRYELCASSAMDTLSLGRLEDKLQTRLSEYRGISKVKITAMSRQCFTVELTSHGKRSRAVAAAGKIGNVVIADAAGKSFDLGTHVRLVCRQSECAAGVKVGRPHPKAKPPILAVVLPYTTVDAKTVQVQSDPSGKANLLYALTGEGIDAWCSFTRSHVGGYVAIVVDRTVVSSPVIESPICGGTGEITGIQGVARTHAIAGYLRSGPLPVSLRLKSP